MRTHSRDTGRSLVGTMINQPLTGLITFVGGVLLGVFLCLRFYPPYSVQGRISQQLSQQQSTGREIVETVVQEIIPTVIPTAGTGMERQTSPIPTPESSQQQATPIVRTTRIVSYAPKSRYSIGVSAEIKDSAIFTYRADASIRLADTPFHLAVGVSTTPTISLGLRYEF